MQSFSKILGIALVATLSLNLMGASPAHAQSTVLTLATDALGKVFDIIEANKPTADVSVQGASALPEAAVGNWELLTGWRPPVSVHASIPLKNHYGGTAVNLEYDLVVTSGGNYNGQGAFISSARIVPGNSTVSWGYTLSVKATVASITNAGTVDNPDAAIVIDVVYDFGSMFKNQSESDSFLIRGDGLIQHINNGEVLAQPNPMPVLVSPPAPVAADASSAVASVTAAPASSVPGLSVSSVTNVVPTTAAVLPNSEVPSAAASAALPATIPASDPPAPAIAPVTQAISQVQLSVQATPAATANLECIAGYCFNASDL